MDAHEGSPHHILMGADELQESDDDPSEPFSRLLRAPGASLFGARPRRWTLRWRFPQLGASVPADWNRS